MTAVQAPRRRPPVRPPARAAVGGSRDRYAEAGGSALALAPERAQPAHPQPQERPNHLRVVSPADRVRRNLTPATAVLLSAGLFALLLAVAVSHTVLVQGQVKLDDLGSQLTEEQLRYQLLRKEVAVLESPSRIVEAAHGNGMVTPDDLVYLQPRPTAATDAGSTTGDDPEPAVDPAVVQPPDRAWSDVKPMLDAPTP